MIRLRPIQAEDAVALFPLIYQTRVTDTILWDGPESLGEFRAGLALREAQTASGEKHLFTILEAASDQPIGSIDIRPEENGFRADIGLWIGEPYHGKGYGTLAVHQITEYGFCRLGLEKIEASVFVGNWASRRIFEKNGFTLEGALRKAVCKRGAYIDEWILGITREDYEAAAGGGNHAGLIVHICDRQTWQAAVSESLPGDGTLGGELRPASLEQVGFIHASRPEQVLQVANRFYREAPAGLLLLWIDQQRVQAEIRWEPADGDLFPHIYGPLNLDAVQSVSEFTPDPDGIFRTVV